MMRIVVVGLILLCLVGCRRFMCSDEVLEQAGSPDGQLVARIIEVNCGATTPFVTVVNIQRTNDAVDANEGVVFSTQGAGPAEVKWEESNLHIRCPACQHKYVSFQAIVKGGHRIIYDEFPSQ